jgi:hypothetical protein
VKRIVVLEPGHGIAEGERVHGELR